MRLPLLVVALALAGCASPDPGPGDGTGPIDASGRLGLLAIDTTTRGVSLLTEAGVLSWMSPAATYLVWTEDGYSVLLQGATNTRQVVTPIVWARIYDNGTGLELAPRAASWRDLRTGEANGSAPLPEAPIEGTRWTGASDDLAVLGVEYDAPGDNCDNDIFLRGAQSARTQGCHLRVARDGRAGWTEGGAVRVMAPDGAIRNATQPGGGDVERDAYVQNENPVFTPDGLVHLRVTGGREVVLTEVVREDGTVLAKVDGPTRVALVDASEDARFLLLRAFER